MTHLSERIVIDCPACYAPSYLERFFQERRPPNRAWDEPEPIRLALRAPVSLPPLKTEIALRREVVAKVKHIESLGDAVATLKVDWDPASGGPFPHFDGTLTASKTAPDDNFLLTLDGDYEPPLKAAGQAFDGVVGNRIASATARALLAEIREAIERMYAKTAYQEDLALAYYDPEC